MRWLSFIVPSPKGIVIDLVDSFNRLKLLRRVLQQWPPSGLGEDVVWQGPEGKGQETLAVSPSESFKVPRYLAGRLNVSRYLGT